MTQIYEVPDGKRKLTFEGTLLASTSSRRPGSPRWTELDLYKTVGGQYVVHKVGRSMVVHWGNCPEVREPIRFVEKHPSIDEPDALGVEYHNCVPVNYDLDQLLSEQDRFWHLVTDSPETVVNELYVRKNRGASLPWAATALLDDASKEDEAIASAYAVQRIA